MNVHHQHVVSTRTGFESRFSPAIPEVCVLRKAGEDLLHILPEWVRFDVEEVVQLACRVNVNAHGLRDDTGANLVIGVGMFPLTAMINHACRPNCTFVYFGETPFLP